MPTSDAASGEHAVVIVGAGPVGMATALGLAHHGVRCTVVERYREPLVGSKAFGVWGRTLETLADWGLSDALLAVGDARDAVAPVATETGRPIFTVDFSVLAASTGMPGLLVIPQSSTERVLRDAVEASPLIDLMHGEVTRVRPDASGVWLELAGSASPLRARYVVGADGSRSAVRESLGERHVGAIIDIDLLVYDVAVDHDDDLDPVRLVSRRAGLLAALRFGPGRWRILASLEPLTTPATTPTDGPPPRRPDVPASRLTALAHEVLGQRDLTVEWQSQTTLYQQRVAGFRLDERVILAGDSAHLVSPAGGQGMNQGIQDAESLAWSLAAALRADDAGDRELRDSMLDGYARERERAADVVTRRARLNSYLEFATPPVIRPPGFLAMRLGLRVGWFARMLSRRLTMRDLRYVARDSARLAGDGRWGIGPVGRRLPDLVRSDGTRLSAGLRGGPAVIAVACDPPTVPPGTMAVRLQAPPRATRLRRGSWAVVRPDRHIAAVVPAGDDAALGRALRDCVGVVQGGRHTEPR